MKNSRTESSRSHFFLRWKRRADEQTMVSGMLGWVAKKKHILTIQTLTIAGNLAMFGQVRPQVFCISLYIFPISDAIEATVASFMLWTFARCAWNRDFLRRHGDHSSQEMGLLNLLNHKKQDSTNHIQPHQSQTRLDVKLGLQWLHPRKRWTSDYQATISGWWFQPLRKILVSWDYYSQYMEK